MLGENLPINRRTTATDRECLSPEQRARLAYALTLIRDTQTLHGWSQFRYPSVESPTVIRLLKHNRKTGRLEQAYTI